MKEHHKHKHHRPSVFTAFNLCVAGHEAGAGSVVTLANAAAYAPDIHWHIVDSPYGGAYQWDAGTWEAAGGLKYGSASGASPEDQTRVFNSYEPGHPREWPNSVPACGG